MPDTAPRPLRILAAILATLAIIAGILAASPLIPIEARGWMALGISILVVVQTRLPQIWGMPDAPAVDPPRVADAVLRVGVVLAVLLAPSIALADMVKRPGAPPPPAWGVLVVPAILLALVVLGAGAVKLFLWAAERRRRALYGTAVLLLLASPAYADTPAVAPAPAPPAAPAVQLAPASPSMVPAPQLPAIPSAPPAPLSEADRVARVVQGAAAAVEAAKAAPVPPAFWSTKAGQALAVTLNVATVVTSAAGAFALVYAAVK